MSRLSWQQLLCTDRVPRQSSGTGTSSQPPSTPSPDPEARSAFEQDYDRIVFSEPFRRLARKTQVHPLAQNDHVHNRLTHSIEVASVGRSFAKRLYDLINENESDESKPSLYDLSTVIQSACLIHDIGNPPFGHAGEEVVRAWFKDQGEKVFPDALVARACKNDLIHFEGNAQGFRVAARPDNTKAGYLRLTYATLASAIKYPWTSSDPRTAQKRKHNINSTEASIFQTIAEALDLVTSDGAYTRHPLSYLVEAADDISYQILDLEDAASVGICNPQEIHRVLWEVAGRHKLKKDMPLAQIRGQAMRSIMDRCWKIFEDQYNAIMAKQYVPDLKSQITGELAEGIQKMADYYGTIFADRKKVATELAAYHILGGILGPMTKSVQMIVQANKNGETYKQLPFLSQKCIELTWGKNYAVDNFSQSIEWWLASTIDFISGLTDNHAVRLQQEVSGANIVV